MDGTGIRTFVAGRAILTALLAGETNPAVLAELARGPSRKQRPQLEQALRRHLRLHQSFVLTEVLAQIDSLDESIARFTAQIAATCAHDADEAESSPCATAFLASPRPLPRWWWPTSAPT
jgi:transposase